MPLRDHFRPRLELRHSWDALHAMWPAVIVQQLFPLLPPGYVAAPGVHVGATFEVDVSAHQLDEAGRVETPTIENGGLAVATQAPPRPSLSVETELADQDEYEVKIYDDSYGRRLVAAIEIISPANKDRPVTRRAFVGKVAALLSSGVCVSMVDIVTTRESNLYAELMEGYNATDPAISPECPALYAVTIRARKRPRRKSLLESWFHPVTVGQPLPTLPIWLDDALNIALDLETSYEEACRYLKIG